MMGGNGGNPEADESPRESSVATPSLSVDAIFDLLANAERRFVLESLTEDDSTVTLEEFVSQLVQWKIAQTGELPSRDNIEMRLYHIHLPKFEEAEIIDYDVRSGDLRYRRDERLETWLQRAQAEATE